MAIYLRGIAASIDDCVDPAHDWPLRFRPTCFTQRKVNLVLRDGDGRSSTSFQVELFKAEGLYCFSAELPRNDDEANEVLDAVKAGFCGVCMGGSLEQYRMSYGHLDVHGYSASTIYLQPMAASISQFAWVEEDGEVTYELQPGVMDAMVLYYECTQFDEPNVNTYYINFNEGEPQFYSSSRCDRMANGRMDGGGSGSGWSARYQSDPLAPPISGDAVILQFPQRMTGKVNVLIAKDGFLQGDITIGPEQMRQLKLQIFDYEVKHGELTGPPDDEDDGSEYAS